MATLLLPVLRTYGMSMSPTLQDGDLVVSVKTSSVQRGDIIAFYYNNKILIPALELSLPVMADWSFENPTECPCRFFGSCTDNNLVICGHNYRGHFAPLWSVDIGTDIYLTSVDRNVYHYIVSNRETLGPDEVDRMLGTEQKDWDLTLFTCTLGGQSRCTVRCIRIDG